MKTQESYIISLSSKGLLTLPVAIRKKYRLEKGSQIEVIDDDGRLIMVPHSTIDDLFGIAKDMKDTVHEMIIELDKEHREVAREH